MKSKFLFFLGGIILVLSLLPLMRSKPPSIPWTRNAETAFTRAEKDGKAVVAYLYTDWCGYCRQMDNTTFKDPDLIQQLSGQFTWLRLNPEKEEAGRSLQQRFGVSGFPTVLILNSNGRELDRIQGYVPASRFLIMMQSLLNNDQEIVLSPTPLKEGDPS